MPSLLLKPVTFVIAIASLMTTAWRVVQTRPLERDRYLVVWATDLHGGSPIAATFDFAPWSFSYGRLIADTAHGSVPPPADSAADRVVTRDGLRQIVARRRLGRVEMLDVTAADAPRLVATLDLGPDARPHGLLLTRDGRRLVILDDGDSIVRVAEVTFTSLAIDARFCLDLKAAALPSSPVRAQRAMLGGP